MIGSPVRAARLWLAGAAVVIGALVVAGIVTAVVTTRGDAELFPADSPEGAVQRYLRALDREEYREAYDYLSTDVQARCTYEDFFRAGSYEDERGLHMTLEDTETLDDTAIVTARVTVFEPNVPFGPSEYSYERTFRLKREEERWRLSWPDWRCPPPPPF